MSKIYLNSEEGWNLLCKTIFEYHNNKMQDFYYYHNKIQYLEGLSELEIKIYGILSYLWANITVKIQKWKIKFRYF